MARPESQSAKPTLVNALVVDKTTAMTASQAILAALYARDIQGSGGQHIDLSMYDSHLAFNWIDLFADHYFANDGVTVQPSGDTRLSHTLVDPSGRVQQKPIIPEIFGMLWLPLLWLVVAHRLVGHRSMMIEWLTTFAPSSC